MGAAVLVAMTASAENYVPLTTEYFSEGMITYLREKDSTTKQFIKTIDGVQKINVDGPTKFNFTFHVNDTKGLRLFKNVTSINATGIKNYCKHFDARGMTKLSSVQFSAQDGNAVSSGGNDKGSKLTTILLDSTAVTAVKLPMCITLKHVSCSHCPELTTVYLYGCDIMGLDLSESPKLEEVRVKDNPHLSVLRLPKSAPKLKYLHCCHTNLQDVEIPEDMANGLTSGNRLIEAINFDATQIKRLKMPVYDPDNGLKSPYVKALVLGNGALMSVNIAAIAKSTGTWTARTQKNNVRVGHTDSFQVYTPDETLYAGTSVSGFTAGAGTYDAATHTFTFNEDKTTVEYKATSYNAKTQINDPKIYPGEGSTKFELPVTVSRTLYAPELYLEFDDNNPTLDNVYEEYMGKDIVESSADGKNTYKRLKFDYKGNNTYDLKPDCLVGNFHLVLVDTDGKETLLGGNDADLSELLPEWENGHVFLDCKKAGTATYALHREQPAVKMKLDSRTSAAQFAYSHPHEFTTHLNEPQNRVGRLDNPTLTVSYIKDDPVNSLTVSAPGGTTGIHDILPDRIPGFGNDSDASAPVIYYDLQGRRVDNPGTGLYIRRQGSKATKVLLR